MSSRNNLKPGIGYVVQMLQEWGPWKRLKCFVTIVKLRMKGEDYLGNKYYQETNSNMDVIDGASIIKVRVELGPN